MKNEDDFFRITFRRNEDVIKQFETNMEKLCGGGISRPLLVATICNYFIENQYSVIWKNGTWEIVPPESDTERSIDLPSTKQSTVQAAMTEDPVVVSETSSPSTEYDQTLSIQQDDEYEEMLRSMGMA